VEQNSKLSSHGNDGPLLGVLASSFGQFQTPTAQVAIRPKRPQDVLSGSNQQAAQVGVSGLRDPQLRVFITRLISTRDKAEGWPHLPALAEAIGIFKCEDEGQGSEWAHAADATELLGLRIAFAAKCFDRSVIGPDLLGEASDRVEDGRQSRSKGLGDVRSDFVSEAVRRAGRQASAAALDDGAGVVDEQAARSDDGIP